MIVFDLCCQPADHRFEVWFRSSADYERQRQGGLLMCPHCGSSHVEKAVMAPAVGRKGNRDGVTAPKAEIVEQKPENLPMVAKREEKAPAFTLSEEAKSALMQIVKVQKAVIAKSRWVGRGFAEEARAIHYGEKEAEPIYGEASPEESQELAEEGVEIAPLLFPVASPEELN